MSDYTYKKSAINTDTMKLKKDTKKNVSICIYNSQKMLTEEVDYGKIKEEAIYSYDKGGNGSLVVEETDKSFGKKGDKAVTTKRGYTYDSYRNVLMQKEPKAYLKKNQGKEHLYMTTYTYHGTDAGYPLEDTRYSLSTLLSEEGFTSAGTKMRMIGTLADNGVDYASIMEQRGINGGEYETISRTDFQYDEHGNETQGRVYPSYSTDGEKEVIQNDYSYSPLGQQTKETVTLTSAKRPQDNRTYTEEEITYDSFGNELSYTDKNGLTSRTSYDPETGNETEIIEAAGTEYESVKREHQSADGLKTMSVDEYGRVTISIQDAFGNTIINKDEVAGTWTESVYEYGSSEDGSEEDAGEDGSSGEDTEEEKEETACLVEERTYTFEPDEKRFIINEDGETVPNYYITGKGKEILSGSKHFYDELGNEIGSASFMNGELDAEHCSSWSFHKNETEVTGEGDSAQSISTSYSKTLNPAKYQPEADETGYYDQFNDAVLSEDITTTVTDAGGNTLSQTSTTVCGENRQETVTTYETDDFGRKTKKTTVTRKQQDGAWLPPYEMQKLFIYDDNGNVSQTETKSRKDGQAEWQTHTVKTDYDGQGHAIREYTPRGMKEGVAAKYEYDILGQMIQSEIPQKKENGGASYQKTTIVYDNIGNVTKKEEQIDSDRTARTEYTYDNRGNLVMVKNCLEENKAQYVQYVYDIMGNKVRQFTGMTEPLTITVSEVSDAADDADTFSYAGKTYLLTVSGQKKSDDIRETRYEYNGKNQLTAFTDPEGRRETYTYDVNSNLTKTVDKNGNTLKNSYDYRNRLTEAMAKEKKTGKETRHTYTYNAYGDVATQDDTAFVYDDVSGQVTKETTKLTKNKDVVKNYTYDSAGNKSAFTVKAGDDTKLSLAYDYDGESRLTSVTDEEGNEVVGYSYDTDGNLAERKVAGSSLTTTYTYDYQNCLTAMKNQTGSAGIISEYGSEYLLNGQKLKEDSDIAGKDGKKSEKSATYAYDLLGRIKKETKTGSKDISYTYDSNNNRKEMKMGNKTTAYKYNKNDKLLRTDTLNTDTEEDSVVIYKYDKNGNQLATVNRYEIPSDKKDSTYIDIDVTLGDNRLNENVVNHYNALNQLTQTLTKNYKVSFTYDAEGLRTSKTVNGEKTVFVWDGDQLVLELSESGKVQKRYVRGNDLVYADKGNSTEKQFYVTDPHGNVVQLTDEGGKVIKTYEYDSFGNEVKLDSKDENPFRYCGEYYDKETGEIYLRARYYQPAVGRFLTRDSYTGQEDDALSLHLYTYCGNDGVNAWDPSGHWSKKVIHTGMTIRIAYKMGYSPFYAWILGDACGEGDQLISDEKDCNWEMRVPNLALNGMTTLNIDDLGFERVRKGSSEEDKYMKSRRNHGKKKLKIQTVTTKEYNRIMNMEPYNTNYSVHENMAICGVWLHAIQDRWAHGRYFSKKERNAKNKKYLGHGKEADNIWYDWDRVNGKKVYKPITSKKIKQMIKENKRFRKMIDATYEYLLQVKKSAGKHVKTGFSVKCCSRDEVYNEVTKYLFQNEFKKAFALKSQNDKISSLLDLVRNNL